MESSVPVKVAVHKTTLSWPLMPQRNRDLVQSHLGIGKQMWLLRTPSASRPGRVLVVDHKLPPSKPVLSPLSVKRRSIAGSGMRTIWEEPASERVLRSASATLLLCHLSSSMGYSCLCTCHVCNKSVKYLRSCAHSAGHLLTHRLRLQMSCTSRRETRHWLFCTVMGVG